MKTKPTHRQIRSMLDAIAKQRKVWKLNKPTRLERKRISHYNAGLSEDQAHLRRPLPPYQYSLTPAIKAVFDRDARNNEALMRVTPDEWFQRINDSLSGIMVRVVANIVWWDCFGDRLMVERWPHLDGMIGPVTDDQQPPLMDVYNALVAIGYTPWQAYKRLWVAEYQNKEEAEEKAVA